MSQTYTREDLNRALKPRDSWWTVLLSDPVAIRLVLVTANRTSITPNQLTTIGLGFGLCAAVLFWFSTVWAFVLGALFYHFSFVADCMDGKIARLKGTGTVTGGWLDYIFDRIRVLCCAVGLFGGLAFHTGNSLWAWLAFVVVFVDMFRYLDVMQLSLIRAKMYDKISEACNEVGADPAGYVGRFASKDDAVESIEQQGEVGPVGASQEYSDVSATYIAKFDSQQGFQSRYGWYVSVRDWLRSHRIRPHLISGIEFQMFIFIVGPLAAALFGLNALVVVVVASAFGLLLFEAILVYEMLLATRDMAAMIEKLKADGSQQVVDQPS